MGPGGWRAAGPRGRRVGDDGSVTEQQGPQRERKRDGADPISEEISRTDEDRKATHSGVTNLKQSKYRGEKHIHRHILVKLMKNRFFFFMEPRFLQRSL